MKSSITKVIFSFLIILSFVSCKKTVTLSSDATVLVKQYKGFPKNEADTIASIIEKIYRFKTLTAKDQKLYSKAYINVKSPRYRADSIIKFQQNELNDSIDYILGLTFKDISSTKRDELGKIKKPEHKYQDWGIMGLAYCPGHSCVVSSFRLKHKNSKIYFNRLKKVAVHEFGHNLGLPHCKNKNCVMTDAVERIGTIDNAKLDLCSECYNQIY